MQSTCYGVREVFLKSRLKESFYFVCTFLKFHLQKIVALIILLAITGTFIEGAKELLIFKLLNVGKILQNVHQ